MEQETQDWIDTNLSKAVYELMDKGILDDLIVEAKPAWMLPMTLLIGKARVKGSNADFYWFLCGDAPLMAADGTVAANPRLAARHFSYQWQLQLASNEEVDPEEVQKAESLYALTEMDQYWT